jgi:hypothetical protein
MSATTPRHDKAFGLTAIFAFLATIEATTALELARLTMRAVQQPGGRELSVALEHGVGTKWHPSDCCGKSRGA